MELKKKLASHPFKPAEKFVKWVEFAANNGDTNDLNLAGNDMSVFAYYSLDIVIPCVLVFVLSVAVVFRLVCAFAIN